MRILQVITPARMAGAERSMLSLCEHLAHAGHEVVVIAKPGVELLAAARSLGLAAEGHPIGGKANLLAPALLARLARRHRADVLHTHLSTASLWGSYAGLLSGVPCVAHVRALNSAACFLAARRIIAVSQAVKDHLVAQRISPDRIDVVYTGIDPARYHLSLSREVARERLGLARDAVIVGVAAHLSPRKGHAVLLEALARLGETRPPVRALCVGDGNLRPALENQAQALGIAERVTFAGYQPDVLPWYAAMDVVALPAVEGEGLPRTLLEGGFLGLPAIASRISGTPEIVADGRTGYLVPPGDADALAERLGQLAADADLRRRLGEAARERIRRTFTVAAMVQGTLAAYQRAGVAG
ncbi:MAG: glycosyltransferase [Armatimonadetes bacterium]|nr:glycosyltransferase [Armatimonadota bacterium]